MQMSLVPPASPVLTAPPRTGFVRWALRRIRGYAGGVQAPPAGNTEQALYGFAQPILGLRVLLSDPALLREALYPAGLLAAACALYASLGSARNALGPARRAHDPAGADRRCRRSAAAAAHAGASRRRRLPLRRRPRHLELALGSRRRVRRRAGVPARGIAERVDPARPERPRALVRPHRQAHGGAAASDPGWSAAAVCAPLRQARDGLARRDRADGVESGGVGGLLAVDRGAARHAGAKSLVQADHHRGFIALARAAGEGRDQEPQLGHQAALARAQCSWNSDFSSREVSDCSAAFGGRSS